MKSPRKGGFARKPKRSDECANSPARRRSVKDSSLSRSVKVTSLPLADHFQLAAARVRAKLEVGQQFLGNRERNRPNRGEPIQRTYAPWNTRVVQKFWPARTDCMLSALLHFLFFWHFSGFLTSRVSFEAWHRDASAVLVCPHGVCSGPGASAIADLVGLRMCAKSASRCG